MLSHQRVNTRPLLPGKARDAIQARGASACRYASVPARPVESHRSYSLSGGCAAPGSKWQREDHRCHRFYRKFVPFPRFYIRVTLPFAHVTPLRLFAFDDRPAQTARVVVSSNGARSYLWPRQTGRILQTARFCGRSPARTVVWRSSFSSSAGNLLTAGGGVGTSYSVFTAQLRLLGRNARPEPPRF